MVVGNRPGRWPALRAPVVTTAPRVALLETFPGDDGDLLDLVGRAGYDGVVVAGFGVGHVSHGLAEQVSVAVARCPVVLASRTGAGTTFTGAYGFVGSERDLLARGALGAGGSTRARHASCSGGCSLPHLQENRRALCPTCAAKYQHARGTKLEDLRIDLLAQEIDHREPIAVDVVLAGVPRQVRFVGKHAIDLQAALVASEASLLDEDDIEFDN